MVCVGVTRRVPVAARGQPVAQSGSPSASGLAFSINPMGAFVTRPAISFVTGVMALCAMAPAYATTRCPEEFGPKDPMVNTLGWAVVAVGLVIGALLLGYAIRRSVRMRPLLRWMTVLFAAVGMFIVWIAGLAAAFVFFFFTC